MGRLKQTGLGEKSGLSTKPETTTAPKKQTTQTEELVTINIKIPKSSKQWLADQAQQVRNNNSAPVPPKERVYPQHLINAAIEMLKNTDVDWSKVQTIEELQEQLNP